MSGSPNSQVSTDEIEEVEIIDESSPSSKPTVNATFNQQNNYHLVNNIDIEKLTQLAGISDLLADRVMSIYENQQQHNINIDNRIIALEEIEQKSRIAEIPHQRRFAFKSLNFAMILSVTALFTSIILAKMGYPVLAGTAITIPIGIAVANMLGKKAAVKTEKKTKNNKENENKPNETEEDSQ